MKGDSGIVIRWESVEVDGSKINVDPSVADQVYRGEFGKRVTLSLINWRDRGLRVEVQLAPGVIADYNKDPYPDQATAEKEYDLFKEATQQRRYRIFADGGSLVAQLAE